MDRSESINELATALAKAQGQMKGAPKESVNPHFKSKYADLSSALEACRGALSANGLALSQHPTTEAAEVNLTTMLMHVSGQFIASTLKILARDAGAQAIGSAITYARRYALMSIIGIAADDDDGNAAEGQRKEDRGPPYDDAVHRIGLEKILKGKLPSGEALWPQIRKGMHGKYLDQLDLVIRSIGTAN